MAFRIRFNRARIAFFHDVFMAAASFPVALYLRLGEDYPLAEDYVAAGTLIFAAVAAPVFWFSRMYRGVWRYASLDDLVAITRAVTLAVLIFLPVMFAVMRLELFPRSLPFIHWFVLLAMLGGPRFVYRVFKDRRLEHLLERSDHRRVPVLLVGADDAAELFIRQQGRDPDATYKVVGVIDDKGGRIGRAIHGIPVLGGIEDMERIVRNAPTPLPQRVVLTHERLDGRQVQEILARAEALGLAVARLPRLSDLQSGVEDALRIRPIAVEDLLGRPQAVLDREAMGALIRGRTVLVTGAGGTIGSELARQICDFAPARIVLFESSEFNLYEIDRELARRRPSLPREALIGDVRDRVLLDRTMRAMAPELVFHAAALKHVPMVEANPLQGVLTNTIGSRNVADACRAAGVRLMVQISTDKAVNPTNVMGATKRLAESYCQALDLDGRNDGGTRFVTVRFGNVLGSTGSVVPLFQEQIARGGPVTVTDPGVTRYFMSVGEAVELVLQASALGVADERAAGGIFVLDMGEPVRIVDLARQMIRLAGKRPDKDIRIAFIGLRPGEKRHERLLHAEEPAAPTAHPRVTLATPRTSDLPLLRRALGELEEAARAGRRDQALAMLRQIVPEFGDEETAPSAATR